MGIVRHHPMREVVWIECLGPGEVEKVSVLSMRLGFVALLMCSVGCQCLFPVADGRDGGEMTDGGRCQPSSECPPLDAGPVADAGACTAPAQCFGTQPTTNWCYQTDAGFSCVERKCLWECPLGGAGRTCAITDGGCLACTTQTVCPINCSGVGYSATVESASACTVWPGTTIPFTDVTVMRTASAQCHYTAFQTAGAQQLGDIWRLSNDEYLAYFPSFGGWCTGRSAYTGIPRGIFNCPLCQFVLAGFE